MNAETIFVLVLTAVAAGFLVWLEIKSRRNRSEVNKSKIAEASLNTPEVSKIEQPGSPQKRAGRK